MTATNINITWEKVTPTRAALWLKQTKESDFNQRPLGAGVVKKYIGEMQRGDWHDSTGDIIRLGESNGMTVVIDGQHRLQAIFMSGKEQNMFVARNIPLDAFKYIDQGNNRTLKDVMDCSGWSDTPTVSSAARYMWVYSETGTPFGSVRAEKNLSAGSLFDWVDQFEPSIRACWDEHGIDLIRKARKGIKMSEPIMFYLFMKMIEQDKPLAVAVFNAMNVDAVALYPSPNFHFAASVIADMQDEMRLLKAKGMKTRSDEHRDPCTMALIFAWNAARKGKEYKTLKSFKTAITKSAPVWEVK